MSPTSWFEQALHKVTKVERGFIVVPSLSQQEQRTRSTLIKQSQYINLLPWYTMI